MALIPGGRVGKRKSHGVQGARLWVLALDLNRSMSRTASIAALLLTTSAASAAAVPTTAVPTTEVVEEADRMHSSTEVSMDVLVKLANLSDETNYTPVGTVPAGSCYRCV